MQRVTMPVSELRLRRRGGAAYTCTSAMGRGGRYREAIDVELQSHLEQQEQHTQLRKLAQVPLLAQQPGAAACLRQHDSREGRGPEARRALRAGVGAE